MSKTEIPELTCEGCKARDRMIQTLSKRIDEMAERIDIRNGVHFGKTPGKRWALSVCEKIKNDRQ